jgi:uncharacterized membrane protein YraQ (UPF0718 family)/copper chaperone CopZ
MIQNLFLDIWALLREMAAYLSLGFLLAGLMHAFIPRQVYANYLSKPNFRSVLLAALFGVPLPLCSCGVLPTAMGLRREGGSKGATVSFLIATPQTGVDSIFATYSLMGLPFAIIRPIVAFITAILGGEMVNVFENKDEIIVVRKTIEKEQPKSFFEKLKESLSYGFVEMMADIGKWLVVGLVVAGMITTLVPDQWFEVFKDNSLLSILLVLCISVPMYVCATGSIPIAVALMMKGLTPGAALVLLMAGPACNVASLLVINKVMGRRTLLLYLASIVGGAVLFALGIDYLLPREWFVSELVMQGDCCHEGIGLFNIISAVVLILLLINALFLHRHHNREEEFPEETEATCFIVEGMHCSHCAANVEKAIRSVEGVENVSVILSEKQAVVSGNYDEIAVREAVESIGYKIK